MPALPWDETRLDAVQGEAVRCGSGDACSTDVLLLVMEVRRLRRCLTEIHATAGSSQSPTEPIWRAAILLEHINSWAQRGLRGLRVDDDDID